MTPYDEVFLPIFLLGLVAAGTLSLIAGTRSGCLLPGVLLLGGTLTLWSALFIGSDLGYRAWQEMPDPPDEAFSDASVLGALILGWVPASIFCLIVFGIARGFRRLSHWANPQLYQRDVRSVTERERPESKTSDNPYQSPGA